MIDATPNGCRYDENPNCAYSQGRLHFAVHVRMGDRREFQAVNVEYFELLEVIMNTISVEVLSRGLQTPLFHVFSETLVPCPSKETGLFDEFPTWPVGVDQVCLETEFVFLPLLATVDIHRSSMSVRVRPPCATTRTSGGGDSLDSPGGLGCLLPRNR